MLNYNKFINNNFLIEGLREMKFVLSNRLINILTEIDHIVAIELLKLHNDLDFKSKQTYIDICDDINKSEYVTFIQSNKASELLNIATKEKYNNIDKSILKNIKLSDPVYNRYRGEIRFGKLINKLFGVQKFSSVLEEFIRLYKSSVHQDEKFELLELVSGEEIKHWYDCDNYYSMIGSLGNSCMGDMSRNTFDIYSENPNIKLLVLYPDDNTDKISARALVWTNLLIPNGKIFVDRVYTNNSSDEQLFIDYAIKNGWLHYNRGVIKDPITNNTIDRIVSQLLPISYEYYPYLDTMCYYNNNNGKISNQRYGMNLMIQYTGGYYNEIEIEEYVEVYSKYYDQYINKNIAKWCEFGEDWLYSNDAIYVFNSGGKYAVPGHPDVVRSYIPDITEKHFQKRKCKWSDYLNAWVYKGSAKKVWVNKEKTQSVIDHKKRKDVSFVEIDGKFYDINISEKDPETGIWKLI